MSDLTASDIAALKNDGGIFGGSGVTLIVLILFFLTIGNGGLWGGNANQGALTRAELYEGLNAQNGFNEFRSISSEITNGFAGVNQNICNGFANNALALNNGFNSVNQNINNVSAQMAQCCCEMKTAVHAEGEATRALIQQNTIQDLRDQVSAKDRELLTTGLTAAQVIQTNNLEAYMRQIMNGCGCNC